MRELNWAVIGCGVIANEMANALAQEGRKLYGIANRTLSKAETFAKKYGVAKVYKSFDELYQDPAVDIVYITTPHNTHYSFIKQALLAGKHVLAEKSITLNIRELDELNALAESKGLILAEAQTIWHMPLYKKLWSIVDSGELGKVQIINANFGSFKEYDMSNRFFNMELAGGALLDIGVYALSAVRSFMTSAPDKVLSTEKPSPTGSDEMSAIAMSNRDGQLAAVTLSMHSKQPKRIVISCEKAYIEIMEYPRADKAVIVDAQTGERKEISEGERSKALLYEILDMENAVVSGDKTALKTELTRDVMDIMTSLRKDWGLVYPEEH